MLTPPPERLAARATLLRRRPLPPEAEVLVAPGAVVAAGDPLARATVPGGLRVIDLARALRLEPQEVARCLLVAVGDRVAGAQVLAAVRWLGSRREATAPVRGTVEALEDGRLYLREDARTCSVCAHVPGRVTAIDPGRTGSITTVAARVAGVWGAGSEARGPLALVADHSADPLPWERVEPRLSGAILVAGTLQDPRALQRAVDCGVAGLVVGSVAPGLVGRLVTLGWPVVATEGLGWLEMAQPVFELLAAHLGAAATLVGTNPDVRWGPELLIPLGDGAPDEADSSAVSEAEPPTELRAGALVRLTRPPYLGCLAHLVDLHPALRPLDLDASVAVVEVRLVDGQRVLAPLANLELLGR